MEPFSIQSLTNVSVPMELTFIMDIVKQLVAVEVKLGMAVHVFVIKDTIGMELYVYFVSMVKFGIQLPKLVSVHQPMLGMEDIVNCNQTVQEIESTTMITKCVFAPKAKSGMELLVLPENHAVVANNGMIRLSNVTVLLISIGMANPVFTV